MSKKSSFRKSFVFVTTFLLAVLLFNPGMVSSGAYEFKSSPYCNDRSGSSASFYKEADFINPWGQQVIVFKKYIKPYYQRVSQGCLTYATSFDNYHWKNINRAYIDYRPAYARL